MKKLFKAYIHSGSRYTINVIGTKVYVVANDFAEAEKLLFDSNDTPWEHESDRKVIGIHSTFAPVISKTDRG